MKALGYAFVVLGIVAFVSLFFGYTHQIVNVFICYLMAHVLLDESTTDGRERHEGGL